MQIRAFPPLSPATALGRNPARKASAGVYAASWIAIACALPAALLTLAATGMTIAFTSIAPLAALAMLCAGVETAYTRYRSDPRIAGASGMLGVLVAASLLAAIISHVGMRLGFAFIDGALSRADLAFGIHAPAIVRAFAAYPDFSKVLEFLYSTSLPACIICGMALAAAARTARAQELAFGFTASILVASTISVFVPALGSTVYHGAENIAGLPPTAGNYHMASVAYFRDGTAAAFDLAKVQGVVTFPSFHIVMAILVPYALRGMGWLTGFAGLWAALVALSTVVIGGHYVVDLVAGLVTWGAAAWYIRPARCKALANG